MSKSMTEVWTAEQLMGVTEDKPQEEEVALGKKGRKSVTMGKGVDQDPMLWGVPGHMTQEEVNCFFQFKDEVEKRGGDFRDTVYSFGEIEGEAFALSRWCRARKFVLQDIIKMVEEATQVRKAAKDVDFYPNPVDALGVDASLFFVQYPQLYSGYTKRGVPLFISKPGILNVDGMECITTLDGILKFHWHIMMHDFATRLQTQKAKDPENFKKFECFCVLDLNKLTTSQLTRRALAIVKEQAAIDSICFPETMCKMLIVNAPTYFTATWRLIKGWLDPRTASKIEVISSRATMEARLLEFVNEDQLPSDYGGKGPDTSVTINEGVPGGFSRLETKMLYLRGHGSETVDIKEGEGLEISVYTRSPTGASFALTDATTKDHFVEGVEVEHNGTGDIDNEKPTVVVINKDNLIKGPTTVKVKADSKGSRFSTSNFLLVFSFKKT